MLSVTDHSLQGYAGDHCQWGNGCKQEMPCRQWQEIGKKRKEKEKKRERQVASRRIVPLEKD
jgi:hypothetical protein